jgi:chromosome segregation ATPase
MPEPTMETRVSNLERGQDKLVSTLDQINKTLLKFENHIDELFEVKTKLDSIDIAWQRIDKLNEKLVEMDKTLHVLKSEHADCKPMVSSVGTCKVDFETRIKELEKKMDAAGNFASGVIGKVIGWLIPGVLGAAAAYLLQGGKH